MNKINSKSRKADLASFLTGRGVNFDNEASKAELLELARAEQAAAAAAELDAIAERHERRADELEQLEELKARGWNLFLEAVEAAFELAEASAESLLKLGVERGGENLAELARKQLERR